MHNILTSDVEDWYQGLGIAPAQWDGFAPRLAIGMNVILELLADHATRATFFVLGIVAQEDPALVRQLVSAGHESGGFYARFWPYRLLRWGIRSLKRQGKPAIVYFHPWEFDLAHPRLHSEAAWLARRTHNHRLARTRGVLTALLRDFTWMAMGDVTTPA